MELFEGRTLVLSGSFAHDYIMNFGDAFENHLMADYLHSLSVCFVVNDMKRHYGGTAMNVGYSLGLLGYKDMILLGAVGKDFDFPHGDLLSYEYLLQDNNLTTASAHIITDQKNNQITAFSPSAMSRSFDIDVPITDHGLCLVSANQKEAMMKHVRQSKKMGMLVFFDPGQQMTAFDTNELVEMVGLSDYLLLNDYEYGLLLKKISMNHVDLLGQLDGLIVTYGSEGSKAFVGEYIYSVDAVSCSHVLDPTGAGDAYRAGLLRGLVAGFGWERAMMCGSACAVACIQSVGTQEHVLDFETIIDGL